MIHPMQLPDDGAPAHPAPDIRKWIHDMRNPLVPLMTGIEIMRGQDPDAERLQLLDIMAAEVDRLAAMLDDLDAGITPAPAGIAEDAMFLDDPAVQSPPGVTPESILVVDDNPNIIATLQLMFGDRGHVVFAATSGEDAVSLAREFKPSVCLCDISLPAMDGFSAASQLRTARPGIRLFSMSGLDDPETRTHSKAAGFGAHFRKPVAFDEMIRVIERDPEAEKRARLDSNQ